MVYRANRLRGSLAARLERAERSETLRTNRLDEEGRIRVDPSTYALLQRLGELDPALLEAYFRAHYGHIRDPWQEAGHPPPRRRGSRRRRMLSGSCGVRSTAASLPRRPATG
jgi:hypothetical protein